MFIESRRTTTAWYHPNKHFTINKRRRLTEFFFIIFLFNTVFLPFLVYAHFIHLLSSTYCLIPRHKNQYVVTIFFSLLFWLSFSPVFSSFKHESFFYTVNRCDFFAFFFFSQSGYISSDLYTFRVLSLHVSLDIFYFRILWKK